MRRKRRTLSYVLVSLASIVLTVAVMLSIAWLMQPEQSKLEALEELILDRFIGEADQAAMEDAAAYAMVGALGDRWSYYIPADTYEDYLSQMRNSYVGIGVNISLSEYTDGIQIESVTPGGPAEVAGIQAGDVIVKVDGTSIIGMPSEMSKKLIRGEVGTPVELTIHRKEEELTVNVIRKEVNVQVVRKQMLQDQIGLISIINFNTNCAKETIAAIEDLVAQGAEKLIFDVRNNPGGYASELVEVLDYLLPEGKLFTQVDYTGNEHTDMSDANYLDMPMAVVVNGESFSAAEFFAAALAEYDAAVVVGERTIGKGYFQTTYRLPDGSAVGLSIGKYFTPKGESLADKGVTPDVTVVFDEETEAKYKSGQLHPTQDPQIIAAIEQLSN